MLLRCFTIKIRFVRCVSISLALSNRLHSFVGTFVTKNPKWTFGKWWENLSAKEQVKKCCFSLHRRKNTMELKRKWFYPFFDRNHSQYHFHLHSHTVEAALLTTSEQLHFISENGQSFPYNISPLFFILLLLHFVPCVWIFCTLLHPHWPIGYVRRAFFADWLRWICNGRSVCVFVHLYNAWTVRCDAVYVHGQIFSYRYLCSVFSAKGQVRSVSIWMMALN